MSTSIVLALPDHVQQALNEAVREEGQSPSELVAAALDDYLFIRKFPRLGRRGKWVGMMLGGTGRTEPEAAGGLSHERPKIADVALIEGARALRQHDLTPAGHFGSDHTRA